MIHGVGDSHFRGNLVQNGGGSFSQFYRIDEDHPLGTGMTCTVKRVTHKISGKHYALKAVRLNRLQPERLAELRQEIEIMKAMDHPNIVKLYQTFEDHSYIYMIMELCSGGELVPAAHTSGLKTNRWPLECHLIGHQYRGYSTPGLVTNCLPSDCQLIAK